MDPTKNLLPGDVSNTSPEADIPIIFAMPDGGDIYCGRPASMLWKHAQQHPHLLLYRSAQTRANQRTDAEVSAFFWVAFIWIIPIWICVTLIQNFIVWLFAYSLFFTFGGGLFFFSLIEAVLAGWLLMKIIAARKIAAQVNWGWERRTWVNTERRNFVSEFKEFGGSPTSHQTVVSLDELTIVGSTNNMWEDSYKYDVDLIRKSDLHKFVVSGGVSLCTLHRGDKQVDADELGQKLAKLWNIPYAKRF